MCLKSGEAAPTRFFTHSHLYSMCNLCPFVPPMCLTRGEAAPTAHTFSFVQIKLSLERQQLLTTDCLTIIHAAKHAEKTIRSAGYQYLYGIQGPEKPS